MAISVAVQGQVQATPGTVPYTGAASGTWTAGSITYRTYSKLTIGGTPVIYEASCQFSFAGSTSGGSPISGTETVTLTAGTTKLQKGANNVLQNGDQKTSASYGNKLAVSSSRKLKSA